MDPQTWRSRTGTQRTAFLRALFATTQTSPRGKRARVACFEGSPLGVTEAFFGAWSAVPAGPRHRLDPTTEVGFTDIARLVIAPSSDRKMMGIAFLERGAAPAAMAVRFRIAHCTMGAGKSPPALDHLSAAPSTTTAETVLAATEPELQAAQPAVQRELETMKIARHVRLARLQHAARYRARELADRGRALSGARRAARVSGRGLECQDFVVLTPVCAAAGCVGAPFPRRRGGGS
jgi:hypothetical protein